MRRVLVLGGYGGFGGRVAYLLAEQGFGAVVAGRSFAKAEAHCSRYPSLALEPLEVDRNADLTAALGAVRPWLVVDAAGPFQGSDYRVAESCIAAGCHYIDLADARDFVCGIVGLNESAKARGVQVISGASSVPALSAAVADRLADGLERLSLIDIALSASNRASGSESVTRAILSYVGKPVRLWRGGRWRSGLGWQEMGKVKFAVDGHQPIQRRVALCDVPDLSLLPERYDGRPAVRFRAGTELDFQNVGLWLLSWPVRWGWLRSLGGFVPFGLRVQKWLRPIGGDRSAMSVLVKGWRNGRAIERLWTLLADRGEGPWIPCLAIPLLAANLDTYPAGARTAAGILSLEQFEQTFRPFSIVTQSQERENVSLYRRVMGERFSRLPSAIRAMHRVNGDFTATGLAEIKRGRTCISRFAGWLFGFPAAAQEVPVSVWMQEEGGAERWHRDFGGSRFSSRLSERHGLLVEKFGLIRFAMELKSETDGLSMHFRRWWIGPLRMPLRLAPRGIAHEREIDGRFYFDVPIALPLIGLIIHYRGWLTPRAGA